MFVKQKPLGPTLVGFTKNIEKRDKENKLVNNLEKKIQNFSIQTLATETLNYNNSNEVKIMNKDILLQDCKCLQIVFLTF